MTNEYEAVMNFINTCPLVGRDMYFNFIDTTDKEANTALYTVPYGRTVKTYTDGTKIKLMQFEIRQSKPLAQYSNTTANTEQMQTVKDFLNWVNTQGKTENFPDFGEEKTILKMSTPDGVDYPSIAQITESGALYAFPFEITYMERM
ncbi:MAG: hypothetical protein IJ365_00125 [Clostridia bacterium]|nr:hypothetical protein [Clostridia bacterium]